MAGTRRRNGADGLHPFMLSDQAAFSDPTVVPRVIRSHAQQRERRNAEALRLSERESKVAGVLEDLGRLLGRVIESLLGSLVAENGRLQFGINRIGYLDP